MIVQTYEGLKFFIEMFKNGNTDLLIIESKGGLAKSRLVEEIMQDKEYLKILAHTTPLKLYMEAFLNKDKPLIFDDVDSLLKEDNNISLLKMLCNTEEFKEVSWFSTSPILAINEIPSKYETRSKVIIICNSFHILTEKIAALTDRGWHVQFCPTNDEILAKMREILPEIHQDLTIEEKTSVYQVIEKYANVCDISLRTLVKGIALFKECNERKIDWKSLLLSSMELNQKLILLDRLTREYEKDSDRISAWEERGYSRRSYYDYKAKLSAKMQTPVENLHEAPLSNTACIIA